MGLFSFTQELAIDLGTANTIIISNGKVLVDEPSIVALDKRTDKLIAVGEVARQMHEKPPVARRSNCRFLGSLEYDTGNGK